VAYHARVLRSVITRPGWAVVIPRSARALGAIALLLLGFAVASDARAQEKPLWADSSDIDLQIRLVTFGPGAAVHQYFGHNALEVRDSKRRLSVLYNFGMFSFGPQMLPKYLQGRLEFWTAATPTGPTFRMYERMGRSVRVRTLDLIPSKRRWLAERLEHFVLPENRNYLYHHYDNNCSTRLRDLIDGAIDGELKRLHAEPGRMSYRAHTLRYTAHDPLIAMLLILWMNDSMEAPITRYQEAFLPDELERLVDDTIYRAPGGVSVKLVRSAATVIAGTLPPVPAEPPSLVVGILGFALVLAALALLTAWWFARKRGRLARAAFGLAHVVVGVVYGVPGLVLGLFLFTEWKVTHWNENLWLINPITFALLPLGLMLAAGSARGLRWARGAAYLLAATSLALCALKLLPMFDQDTTYPMLLALPVNWAFAAAHRLAAQRAKAAA
jgi:hypothetical protein